MDHSVRRTRRGCYITFHAGLVLLLLAMVATVSTFESSSVSTVRAVTSPVAAKGNAFRLPKSVFPLLYELQLKPNIYSADPANFTLSGNVRILIRCDNETNKVTLNLNGPTVDPSSIKFYHERSPFSMDPSYRSFEEDKDKQFFTVLLTKNMEVGMKYWIQMSFSSPLRNVSEGIYYNSYTRSNKTIYLVSTQFQPVYARKAFPCFDEPGMKAVFKVIIVRATHFVSLSNMLLEITKEDVEENGITYVKDVYKQSPNMSTYTLGFVVCDFAFRSKMTKHGSNVRVWARNESLADVDYVLNSLVTINEYFGEIFGIKYPLQKQDVVGLLDFENTANWGVNLYKDSRMLYNEKDNTEEDKENVARMVSYQSSREWFGNLVTPAWWSDLWLKEGFAGFYEHVGVNKLHPNWQTFDHYVMDKVHIALQEDATFNNRPVVSEVEEATNLADLYDWVTYRKAPSLVRMMQFFLGETTFQKGIANFLTTFANRTATHDDLFNELTKQATTDGLTINVKDIMDTWILQMNYPVVTVSRDFNNHDKLLVTQERFLSDPSAKDPGKYEAPFHYRWSIPLTFASSASLKFDHVHTDIQWMHKEERTKVLDARIPLPACSEPVGWILANINQKGYFRVNYQAGNWYALGHQLTLNHKVIPVINRAQLINDVWNLAGASYVSVDLAFKIVEYMGHEYDYLPWFTAFIHFRFVDMMLSFSHIYGGFQSFMMHKIRKPYEHLHGNVNNATDHMDKFSRSLLADLACYYHESSCVEKAILQYSQMMTDPLKNKIPNNIKKLVYCQAIASGDWKEFHFALKMFRKEEKTTAKEIILNGLACSEQPWILNHLLNILLETEPPCSDAHALAIITLVVSSSNGRYLAWDFYRVNYKTLKAKYYALTCQIALPQITEFFNTQLELEEVIAFREEECLEFDQKQFDQQIVGNIKGNMQWIKTNMPTITKWMVEKKFIVG